MDLLQMLQEERAGLKRKIAGVDAAIRALNGTGVVQPAVKKRTWTMSAEARKKISLAQKRRWAKVKK
jgi:hypothetical protein